MKFVLALTFGLAALGGSDPAGVVRPGEAPVVLVPGWFDTARAMAALQIRLMGAGWPAEEVITLTFEDPTGSNRVHARELADTIEAVLQRTGAEKVDIVAHSMGGLATRAYLREEGGAKVRRVAFLATPHRGTLAAYLAFGQGRDDMIPASPFLAWLNAVPPLPPGVEAITVRTPVDTHILPNESATLPGVEDHTVCCPTHAGLLENQEVFGLVRRFLDDGPLESVSR